MLKRTHKSPIAFLVLLFVLLFVSCSTPPATTSAPTARAALPQATPTSAPSLTDLHSPDDLKIRFNQDAGVPRIILLVSPT
jgi:photosystem II stability/assembly factor-like uncharacterized protein